MAFFTSAYERKLWGFALLVIVAIFTTLFINQPIIKWLTNQNVQAAFFLMGMLLTGIVILFFGLKYQPNGVEIVVWLGLFTVYLMLFLRLGLAERSHLIEYSILAILIFKIIQERKKEQSLFLQSLIALIITILIGTIDELLQLFIPSRVFDFIDILFNSLAACFAIGASLLLHWLATFRATPP